MKQMTTSHSETISAQFEIKQTQFCGSYFIQIFFWGGGGGRKAEANIIVIFEVINLHYFI